MAEKPVEEPGADALTKWLEGGGKSCLDFVMGGALDIVGVVDRDLRIRYVNWTAPGLTPEGIVGLYAVDLSPPEYQETARNTYLRVFETGIGSRFDVMYRDDAQILMWDVRVGPITVDGQVIGLVTINADVTEQHKAQADRARFFELSLDLLIVASPDGRFRRASRSFSETLGYSAQEIAETPFLDFVHADDRAKTVESFDNVLSGRPVIDFENRYRRSDGEYRVLSWRSIIDPLSGDLYGVARDITEHRATELQLRQSQKMEAVGQLAGGVAHDFNNLMLAILANAELALMDEPSPPAAMALCLGEIQAAALRAADLTKQLLAFSRRQPLRAVPVDLGRLANGLMSMLQRLIPEHIAVELVLSDELAAVNADTSQMEQVIVNLCVNARDAMDRGGELTITAKNVVIGDAAVSPARPGRYVLLSVCDTGPGMTPEVRERIFEPFFSTKPSHAGTGLGLSTVYGIVQQHSGTVDVDTEVGRGTTFNIHIPALDCVAPDTASKQTKRSPIGHETILFAEDEESVRSAMVGILERAGYQTIVAVDGVDALRLVRERTEAIHLALLDVVMPRMGGPEAWEQMRSLRPGLKVLFCSGYADDRYLQRLPPDAEILEKPFNTDVLLRRIRQELDS